ncbi:MAG: 3-deoxy-8-phosphooctulonate synthase [Candidatus Cloacimonetes bacterium]|nr:3-deoxy-8-phosphooctulonate synthase [Candidatus Cloacimonadota bacterium]MCF7815126.1 3-deoxy-8-phosphooctulonate synthase [Candidatus Cloacimonadota bacterium]MCF7869357.1 3-deoxy-8-phosphooctulonate synthase [Candidatus Cloacimonadota bacterium]MCF7884752.1 3-deoxy-8-phosphooctulonate synthase [Candidatus Cloacimonadota bacterium]
MDLFSELRNEKRLFLLAGPCVVENEATMFKTAEFLKEETSKRDITFVFKSSYKKANRTSISSPVGVGLEEGLKLLQKIKKQFEVPILTDVHETTEVQSVAEVADILQIPAFLSRQTELLIEAGRSGKIVNIKKGQFMAPLDMKAATEKVISVNNYNILLTERGTSFGYHNLVVDFRSFAILKQLKFPVVYDVTHSLQQPSIGNVSGGTPEFVPMMARAAVATGMVNGLFIETHPNPVDALSDAQSMLPLHQIPEVLDGCLEILKVNNERL